MSGAINGFLSRRRFVKAAIGSALTLAAGGLGAGLYANQYEPFAVDEVRRDLPVERLPAALAGQTLVHLSDLHVGATRLSYLAATLARVARLEAALVVITGDLTDSGTEAQRQELGGLLRDHRLGTVGTVATLGNHDYGAGRTAAKFRTLLGSCGVTLLRNEAHTVAGLNLIGLDDLWQGDFRPQDVLPQRNRHAATIVLSHNPDTADRPVWGDYRGWILSGHTHGGQVSLPGLGAVFVPVANKNYVAGEYEVGGGRRLYINRGLGYSKQVRLAARPEITVFTLQQA